MWKPLWTHVSDASVPHQTSVETWTREAVLQTYLRLHPGNSLARALLSFDRTLAFGVLPGFERAVPNRRLVPRMADSELEDLAREADARVAPLHARRSGLPYWISRRASIGILPLVLSAPGCAFAEDAFKAMEGKVLLPYPADSNPYLQQAIKREMLLGEASGVAIMPKGRTSANRMGIDQKSILPDPRDLKAEKGLIWGAREYCDPTTPTCRQGGIEKDPNPPQPKPATPKGIEIKDRVEFTVTIANKKEGKLALGLWRSAAPVSVDAFMQTADSNYAPTAGDKAASYEGAIVSFKKEDQNIVFSSIDRGGQYDKGREVEVEFARNKDKNPFLHSEAGLVSVRKGGGSFEFSISTRSAPKLDKDWIVIGQVLEGMDLLERLNVLPINLYSSKPMAPTKARKWDVLASSANTR